MSFPPQSFSLRSMRRRVYIEREEQTLDEAGGASSAWIIVSAAWANFQMYGSPKEVMADGRAVVRLLWWFQIRRRQMSEGMRFRVPRQNGDGERVFRILSVSEDAERRFMHCICEEQH